MSKTQLTYLVYDGRLYKIGKSIHPEKRLQDLKVANPYCELICAGDCVEEKDLHTIFYRKHIKGEWFDLKDNEVKHCIKLITGQIEINPKTLDKRKIKQELWQKYENYVITFGKYNGTPLIHMTEPEDIDYIKWFLRARQKELKKLSKRDRYREKNSLRYKAFTWWTYNYGKYID